MAAAMPQQLPDRKKTALRDKSEFSWSHVGVSLGGGLATAAVFAVLTKGTPSGLILAHLAPLPIMIVALGFGLRHGATSAIIATGLLSIWPHPQFGFTYAVIIAAPAMLACWAATGAPWKGRNLLGRHLPAWATLAAGAALVVSVSAVLIAVALYSGGLDEALNPFRARAYIVLEDMIKSQDMAPELKERLDAKQLSGAIARAFPALLAGYVLLAQSLNLWGAGRLTQISGRLGRPWPDIATEYVLPRAINGVFLVGVGLTFINGLPGAVGLVIAIAAGLLLAFQGLAVAHVYLRGAKVSVLALALIYLIVGMLGWPIMFFTLIGSADAIFSFRVRKAAARDKTIGPGTV
jgi:hypothetical protein